MITTETLCVLRKHCVCYGSIVCATKTLCDYRMSSWAAAAARAQTRTKPGLFGNKSVTRLAPWNVFLGMQIYHMSMAKYGAVCMAPTARHDSTTTSKVLYTGIQLEFADTFNQAN